MKNLDLYTHYATAFGLTFLPKGFDDKTWQVATELMKQALEGKIDVVTHQAIDAYIAANHIQNQPETFAAA